MIFKSILISVILFTSSIVAFEDSRQTSRIINGTLAIKQVPWVVRLITKKTATTIVSNCGGSLIADRWVLTAKHCLIERDGSASGVYMVSVGNNDFRDGQFRKIIKRYFHEPTKTKYLVDDIALLKLDYPVKNIAPVKMQVNDNLKYRGKHAIIYGWGTTVGSEIISITQLHTTSVILVDKKKCELGMICFDPKLTHTNACRGDSGGPMVYVKKNETILIGITSTVTLEPYCSDRMMSRYVSVPYWINWIRLVTRIMFI